MSTSPEHLVEQLHQLRLEYAGGSATTNPPNPPDPNPTIIESVVREVLERMNASSVGDFRDMDSNITLDRTNMNELDRIPDMVKCLREFSGKPGEFSSWRKSVDRILKAYEALKDTPKYFSILHTIRHKIVGDADTALESYSTPLEWNQIRKCLMMHYSDKRDIGTLEYQMTTLAQRHDDISTFYQKVYQHLSLILDKIACLDLGEEAIRTMTNSYREKALDTFIRGLNGDLPRLLSIREPTTLPQALNLCQKLDNMSFRMNHAHTVNKSLSQHPPRPPRYSNNRPFYPELTYSVPPPRYNYNDNNNVRNGNHNNYRSPNTNPRWQPNQGNSNNRPHNNFQPNANFGERPQQQYNSGFNNRPNLPPKPPTPMEVDSSLHSGQVNYQNRPNGNYNTQAQPQKRPLSSQHTRPPNKMQRNFHVNAGPLNTNDYQGDPDPNQIYDTYPQYEYYPTAQDGKGAAGGQINCTSGKQNQTEPDLINFLD